MNPKDLKPGPIRHAELSAELIQRIDSVRVALEEVCDLTEAEWLDAFQRDVNPDHELMWWERVARCYVALIEARTFSPNQRQAAFNIIFGLFSGLEASQLHAELAKLPESVMDDLALIVRHLVP